MEKLMNKMDNMELDMVAGGRLPKQIGLPRPRCHDNNANSMAANVDETQMRLPIAGGHKINV